MREILSDSETL